MGAAAACVLPSFPGAAPPDWIRRFLACGGLGVMLFADSVGAAAALRAERGDVLLALDEEGGDVTRLHVRDGSPHPSAAALGAIDDLELTEDVAASIAAELGAAGINWNLAPVADVNVAANPVIGTRAFGSDPALVARHVAATVRGLQRSGVAACAKHFPGHGSTTQDSHLELPELTGPLEAGLDPFRAAVAAGVAAVMTAHVKVHDDAATLDPEVIGLLRRDLGFDGVIVTDALEMRGITAHHDVAEAAVLAVEAGADAVIVGHDLGEEETTRIVAALERVDRVDEAAARVAQLADRARPAANGAVDVSAAARRALLVEGDVSGGARVVELRPAANIAAGDAEHSLADTIVREGEPVPDADVYVVRDAHRHAWMQHADRDGAVIVEIGLPVWRPSRARGYVATYGGGRASLDAAAEVLRR
ncbi:MAG TPA: glycoside hydrolase family 3 N-terminal domain-containing protein [Gaiellaceae bacterium]